MTPLAILRYPDARLKVACAPVVAFDDDLRRLSSDLLQAMRTAPGVGITAAHVGIMKRVVVIELQPGETIRTLINPEIVWSSPQTARHLEGSVCMPGATEEVVRPSGIRYTYRDIDGAHHEDTADGFLAACIQHEIDQLDGIFWLQRLSKLKRDRLVKKWEKGESARRD